MIQLSISMLLISFMAILFSLITNKRYKQGNPNEGIGLLIIGSPTIMLSLYPDIEIGLRLILIFSGMVFLAFGSIMIIVSQINKKRQS
ncbi:hypothetical protein IC620_10970 [Hazenella sp. IB182357]|uniref:Uncharacterized protein n=1 Tax=Polycladospora coralii TaxID=2771432 RepID=A0A926NAI2_9BACL|nr:hypothetical protein [Polycladospora coralii]MBD1372878.1 hypothetical protein [Polycladospora coralii]